MPACYSGDVSGSVALQQVRNACKPNMGLSEDHEVRIGKVRVGGGKSGRGRR